MRTPVLILGGGISGLSAAYYLRLHNIPHILMEKEERVGGVCVSFKRKEFCFDALPHIFFSRHKESVELFQRLMKRNFVSSASEIKVFSHQRWIGFPFQTNLHGLPQEVVRDCLIGYLLALLNRPNHPVPADFAQWVEAEFGDGIVKHFLGPYNNKFWQFELSKMTYDWAIEKIIIPRMDQVVDGALGTPPKGLSAHANFFYPREGGIEALPRALLAGANPASVRTGTEVCLIRGKDKVAITTAGEEIAYERLISTVPLFKLVWLLHAPPAEVRDAAAGLCYNGVVAYHVAIKRAQPASFHWAYFSEDCVPFYRVMQQSALTGGLCPPGWSTLICEVAFPMGRRPPLDPLRDRVVEGLRVTGLLKVGDEYEVSGHYVCEPAYVIYDLKREEHLSKIKGHLEELGILTAGRYGSWEYLNMDGCLESGKLASSRVQLQSESS